MARNGPFGQARAPQRRHPAEQDPYATGPNGHWPQQQNGGYPDANGAPQGYTNGQQAQGGYHFPQNLDPEPQYYPQQNQGYDRYPAPLNGQAGQDRNYDLGSYMPSGGQQGYAGGQQGYAQDAPPFNGHGYAEGEGEGEYDEMLAEDDEEPRGRRWMLIVVALVGAVTLGGGLAYTYKMFFTSGSGRAVVKAIDFPNKVKPTVTKDDVAGEKKLPTRLGDDGPTSRSAAAEPDAGDDRAAEATSGGPRPVRIIPLAGGAGQNGQQQGTANTSGGSAGTAKQVVVVPGLMIDTPGSGAGQGRVVLPQGQMNQGMGGAQGLGGTVGNARGGSLPGGNMPVTTTDQPLPQRKVVSLPPTNTTTTTANTTTNAAVAKETAHAVKVPVPRKETTATASTGSAPVSNGYVAVLSSQRTHLDAMKAYANLDQKYRDMLASSTFDVQEADLGAEKGIWYRAVVGPPRSFDGAKKICDELKSAGYPSCWPARY